jgi:hypothetical protein
VFLGSFGKFEETKDWRNWVSTLQKKCSIRIGSSLLHQRIEVTFLSTSFVSQLNRTNPFYYYFFLPSMQSFWKDKLTEFIFDVTTFIRRYSFSTSSFLIRLKCALIFFSPQTIDTNMCSTNFWVETVWYFKRIECFATWKTYWNKPRTCFR